MSRSRTLIVLARAPSVPGKSRLTGHLPRASATAVRAALLFDTLGVACEVGARVAIAYTPHRARPEMEALIATVAREGIGRSLDWWPPALVPQRGEDLGARMHQAFVDVFAAGADAVVLIGSDLPTLPAAAVTEAFVQLDAGADVVVGPTDDGGYYLIGVSEPRAELFGGVPWGTPDVLAVTRAHAARARLSVALVTKWYDVDRPEDAGRVMVDGRATGGAARTRAALRAAGLAP